MAVRTDVINAALIELGQPISVGIDSDTRDTVVSLRGLYERHARMLLMKYPWNFCKEVVQLTQVSGTPVGWEYKFNKPPACLRILKVDSRADMERRPGIPFEERKGHIYTNHEDTFLAYIDGNYATNDSGGWPELVVEALAFDLARKVASGLDRSATEIERLKAEVKRSESEARRWDAQQNQVERPSLSAWQRNHVSGGPRGENG